jgi:hypothetical protein
MSEKNCFVSHSHISIKITNRLIYCEYPHVYINRNVFLGWSWNIFIQWYRTSLFTGCGWCMHSRKRLPCLHMRSYSILGFMRFSPISPLNGISIGWLIDWLIDWCFTPTLAILQLYRGVIKFYYYTDTLYTYKFLRNKT